jgi:NAD(P)-dependent dehydrogenase (short-subunit alcohol dehydrogenase family)
MSQKGPIGLITGAAKGIGFETGRQLARRGWHIVIGARNPQAGQDAAARLGKEGGSASFLAIDVAESDSIARAAAEYRKQFDHLKKGHNYGT